MLRQAQRVSIAVTARSALPDSGARGSKHCGGEYMRTSCALAVLWCAEAALQVRRFERVVFLPPQHFGSLVTVDVHSHMEALRAEQTASRRGGHDPASAQQQHGYREAGQRGSAGADGFGEGRIPGVDGHDGAQERWSEDAVAGDCAEHLGIYARLGELSVKRRRRNRSHLADAVKGRHMELQVCAHMEIQHCMAAALRLALYSSSECTHAQC